MTNSMKIPYLFQVYKCVGEVNVVQPKHRESSFRRLSISASNMGKSNRKPLWVTRTIQHVCVHRRSERVITDKQFAHIYCSVVPVLARTRSAVSPLAINGHISSLIHGTIMALYMAWDRVHVVYLGACCKYTSWTKSDTYNWRWQSDSCNTMTSTMSILQQSPCTNTTVTNQVILKS